MTVDEFLPETLRPERRADHRAEMLALAQALGARIEHAP